MVMSRYIDAKGRLVLPETREQLKAMSEEELRKFRERHVHTGYGGLVQAADEELERRKAK
jgi:hypothetical protein